MSTLTILCYQHTPSSWQAIGIRCELWGFVWLEDKRSPLSSEGSKRKRIFKRTMRCEPCDRPHVPVVAESEPFRALRDPVGSPPVALPPTQPRNIVMRGWGPSAKRFIFGRGRNQQANVCLGRRQPVRIGKFTIPSGGIWCSSKTVFKPWSLSQMASEAYYGVSSVDRIYQSDSSYDGRWPAGRSTEGWVFWGLHYSGHFGISVHGMSYTITRIFLPLQ